MKRVLVGVKSIQRDADGHDTVIEMVSPGEYHEKNDTKYIMYNETELSGMEGSHTTIKLKPRSIVLIRNGKVSMRHEYVLGETRQSVYETPFGELHMAFKTHELESDLEDGIGKIHLGYDISVSGDWQYYNQLDIVLQEDLEYVTKGQAQARN